jgi:hypothetical protein
MFQMHHALPVLLPVLPWARAAQLPLTSCFLLPAGGLRKCAVRLHQRPRRAELRRAVLQHRGARLPVVRGAVGVRHLVHGAPFPFPPSKFSPFECFLFQIPLLRRRQVVTLLALRAAYQWCTSSAVGPSPGDSGVQQPQPQVARHTPSAGMRSVAPLCKHAYTCSRRWQRCIARVYHVGVCSAACPSA